MPAYIRNPGFALLAHVKEVCQTALLLCLSFPEKYIHVFFVQVHTTAGVCLVTAP